MSSNQGQLGTQFETHCTSYVYATSFRGLLLSCGAWHRINPIDWDLPCSTFFQLPPLWSLLINRLSESNYLLRLNLDWMESFFHIPAWPQHIFPAGPQHNFCPKFSPQLSVETWDGIIWSTALLPSTKDFYNVGVFVFLYPCILPIYWSLCNFSPKIVYRHL